MATNKPAHDFKVGSVKTTIWTNQTASGSMHSATFARLYKKGEEWKLSRSFSKSELEKLAEAVAQAQAWMKDHEQAA